MQNEHNSPAVRHILVVCQSTADGDQALFTAAALAEQTGARLTVAAVADINMPGRRRCCGSGAMCLNHAEREDAASRLLRAELLLTDGPDADFITTYGVRATALIQEAAHRRCDLIVIPASPRSKIPGWALGDDARRVRRLATVPILQTPPAGARGLRPCEPVSGAGGDVAR